MNFLKSIIDSVKRKSAEMKDRKEFLDMVENDAKPIRRKAYYQQMLKEVIEEGKEKPKQDATKKAQKTKTPQDFGIGQGLQDPYKYLNSGGKK